MGSIPCHWNSVSSASYIHLPVWQVVFSCTHSLVVRLLFPCCSLVDLLTFTGEVPTFPSTSLSLEFALGDARPCCIWSWSVPWRWNGGCDPWPKVAMLSILWVHSLHLQEQRGTHIKAASNCEPTKVGRQNNIRKQHTTHTAHIHKGNHTWGAYSPCLRSTQGYPMFFIITWQGFLVDQAAGFPNTPCHNLWICVCLCLVSWLER